MNPTFRLDGKVVAITGGAGRIGSMFCQAVVEAGGVAGILDIDANAAQSLAQTLNAKAGRECARSFIVDTTQAPEVDAAIAELASAFGAVAALVNNAYPRVGRYGARFEEVTYEDFCGNVGQHLGGYFLCAQRFARHAASHGGGAIVNMASIYGVVAPRFEIYEGSPMTMPVEYAAIKAGLIHLTKYLAQYLKPVNVRVNAISPGGIFAQQPSPFVSKYQAHAAGNRMLSPDDLIGGLLLLLSDAGEHINGQNLVIDDGWTL